MIKQRITTGKPSFFKNRRTIIQYGIHTHELSQYGNGNTDYHSFQAAGWIMETKTEGRRRSYLITPAGEQALAEEYQRLQILSEDYRSYMGRRGEIES